MVSRYPAISIVFLFALVLYGISAMAQPALPDFAGSVDKGVIVLSWNCQYKGVKSIAILRSADGLSGYSTIGYVANVDKGLQVFVDGHPLPGKNCYKLGISFSSGLKWSSNSNCFTIDKNTSALSSGLPSNDSIQSLIVTQDVPAKHPGGASPSWQKKSALNAEQDDADSTDEPLESAQKYTSSKSAIPPKVSVSYRGDTARSVQNAVPAPQGKKIVLSFEDADENSSQLVKSRFISADAVTGHVIMNLPADVATHHYSIKFFDDKNTMITEVPKINAPKIIIDKRNFQRRGTYKFKIHRDGLELETGYVYIVPNP